MDFIDFIDFMDFTDFIVFINFMDFIDFTDFINWFFRKFEQKKSGAFNTILLLSRYPSHAGRSVYGRSHPVVRRNVGIYSAS